MQAKTERFEMRLDQGTIDKLDKFRNQQGDLPSRAEAVRRLLDIGLGQYDHKGIRISDSEKLILSMLCGLYKHLKVDNGIDPDFVEEVIFGGHYWGLEWKYSGLFHGHEDDYPTVYEVVNILDMWYFIESGYDHLSTKERERFEKETPTFGEAVKFDGFSGNEESEEMGIAYFLVNKLDRFTSFKGRDFNAHFPTIDGYRRMLAVYEPMRVALRQGELNSGQIINLLKARIHPENRES